MDKTTKRSSRGKPSQKLGSERITKTIRIAKALEMRLKTEAYQRTIAGGARVTESDLIEEALLKFLKV